MPDKLFFVEGDTKPDVYFSIKDSSGAAIDVSDAGADVYFRYRQINVQDGAPASGEIALSKPNGGADGVVMLEWGDDDLLYPGDYNAEIVIDWGADLQTIPDIVDYNVRPRIRLSGESPAVPDPDLVLPADGAVYFGMPTTEGSWRIIRDGDDLVSQRYESGVWVTKQTTMAIETLDLLVSGFIMHDDNALPDGPWAWDGAVLVGTDLPLGQAGIQPANRLTFDITTPASPFVDAVHKTSGFFVFDLVIDACSVALTDAGIFPAFYAGSYSGEMLSAPDIAPITASAATIEQPYVNAGFPFITNPFYWDEMGFVLWHIPTDQPLAAYLAADITWTLRVTGMRWVSAIAP